MGAVPPRGPGERAQGRAERLEVLITVAGLYYEEGLTEAEIAPLIGASRSSVSRMLTEARSLGLVKVSIQRPSNAVGDLGDSLASTLGLKFARVAPSGHLPPQVRARAVGRLAAEAMVDSLEGLKAVSIGWGVHVFETVRAVPPIPVGEVMVYQPMGSLAGTDPEIYGSRLARQLAEKLGGDYRYLPAPLIVDSRATAQSLLGNPAVASVLEAAEKADMAVFGIGSSDGHRSSLVRAGYIDPARFEQLGNVGVVGDLFGYLFDETGALVDVSENERVVSFHPSKLAGIPTVIAVVTGADRAVAARAVLRAGYANALVTDEETARRILGTATAQDRSESD